ncbi:uncharacterized protein Z518_01408 [Rhinocladiella mackenziei CBS 650.93]|uniref:NAD dependent epimerase/dehydratase n=1 Tax=Rhinocladiella mackenziei CBS 650.93 TaxID=1442369 RepID=A0A0D2J3M5_9EURO|nr:uncharacterized protein Z518_01408 [Rhinocladiella mackenziei CBS 650.93]KIX10326.1 hypothetical protein Z518_01408 [Rhinocladiella mackenziei CBS 650.93]
MASLSNPLHKLFGISAKEHGESQWHPNSNAELEGIGLGLSRTGTTSLREALDDLGFGPVHHAVELYRRPQHNDNMIAFLKYLGENPQESKNPSPETKARIRKLMHGYRSTVDGPLCDMIPELVATYPNAKFILSVRDSEEIWWKSWRDTVGMHFLTETWRYRIFSVLISSVRVLRRTDDMAQEANYRTRRDFGFIGPQIYRLHNQKVRDLVPKGQLLEHNVKDGWGPLCPFLGVDVPKHPFPRRNESDSVKAIYFGQQVFGACAWAFYCGLVGGIAYLAATPETARSVFSASGLQRVFGLGICKDSN